MYERAELPGGVLKNLSGYIGKKISRDQRAGGDAVERFADLCAVKTRRSAVGVVLAEPRIQFRPPAVERMKLLVQARFDG